MYSAGRVGAVDKVEEIVRLIESKEQMAEASHYKLALRAYAMQAQKVFHSIDSKTPPLLDRSWVKSHADAARSLYKRVAAEQLKDGEQGIKEATMLAEAMLEVLACLGLHSDAKQFYSEAQEQGLVSSNMDSILLGSCIDEFSGYHRTRIAGDGEKGISPGSNGSAGVREDGFTGNKFSQIGNESLNEDELASVESLVEKLSASEDHCYWHQRAVEIIQLAVALAKIDAPTAPAVIELAAKASQALQHKSMALKQGQGSSLISLVCSLNRSDMIKIVDRIWDSFMEKRRAPTPQAAHCYAIFLEKFAPSEEERITQARHFAEQKRLGNHDRGHT